MPVQNKPIIHARDHLEDGADPIRGLLTAPAGTIDEAILALDPGAYYKLNETGSDDWADSADARDATYVSRTGEVRGVASDLDEGDGSLSVGVHGPSPGASPAVSHIATVDSNFFCMPGTSPFTVTARIRPASVPGDIYSMGICGTIAQASISGYGWGLYLVSAATNGTASGTGGGAGFVRGTSGGQAVIGTGVPATIGEWIRITGVYDGTDLKLYVDDTHIGDTAGVGSLPGVGTDTDTFQIGAVGIGEGVGQPQQPFDGEIDSVAVWDRALTPDEIGGIADFDTGAVGGAPAGSVPTSDGLGGVAWALPTLEVDY